MRGKTTSSKVGKSPSTTVRVQLDAAGRSALAEAALGRGVSVSDYVRTVAVGQARREVEAAASRTLVLAPDEQLAFWRALNAPAELTPAQRRLGALMCGEG